MPIKVCRINPGKFNVYEDEIVSWDIVDKFYVRTVREQHEPAAYFYPIEKADEVRRLMEELKVLNKAFVDRQAEIFYQELPRIRASRLEVK